MPKTRLACTTPAFATLSADLLHAGIALRFTAQGSSMLPLLRSGDILVVKPVDDSRLKIGDVVLCAVSTDRVVAHRIIRRRTEENGLAFLVQGDRVGKPDGWIPQAQVLGRVDYLERSGRQINLQSGPGRLLGMMQSIKLRCHLSRWGVAESVGRVVKQLSCFTGYMT